MKDINTAASYCLSTERSFSQTLVLISITMASSQMVIRKWNFFLWQAHMQQGISWAATVFGDFGCSLIPVPPKDLLSEDGKEKMRRNILYTLSVPV